MNNSILCIKILVVLTVTILFWKVVGKKMSRKKRVALCAIVCWLGYFCSSLAATIPSPSEKISLQALRVKDERSEWYQVVLLEYGSAGDTSAFLTGTQQDGFWLEQQNQDAASVRLTWVPENDNFWQDGITDSISLEIPLGSDRILVFGANRYGGQAQVEYRGKTLDVNTYFPSEKLIPKEVQIPDTPAPLLQKAGAVHLTIFCGTFLLFSGALWIAVYYISQEQHLVKLKQNKFLFEELVKRDFSQKYKRTILGMLWSILSPLINLLIMWVVFNQILGAGMDHYVIYLFAGQMLFSYFNDATMQGMTSLLDNAPIFTKVSIPKYMFLFSKNISSLINFALTFGIFLVFVLLDGLRLHIDYLMLIYPLGCFVIFNLGLGMVLSALFVFFRDMQYLWGVATQLIMWLSAIFYSIDTFPKTMQNMFLLNPIYQFILYLRTVVIDGAIPDIRLHLLIGSFALGSILLGCYFYKKYNHEFLYYV